MQNKPYLLSHNAEDVDLVLLAKKADPGAFAILTERYMPILRSRASKYSKIERADTEDFIQEGLLALYRAVQNYDPSHGIQFRTYAVTCIDNSMISAYRAQKKSMKQFDGVHLDEMDDRWFYQQISPKIDSLPEEFFFQTETENDHTQKIDALLSEFERRVLKMYLGGNSYEAIAKVLCTSKKAVDNALQRARRKLRPSEP